MGIMNRNLTRVWTRDVGGRIEDLTFPYDKDFEVVVDAEAELGIFHAGARYGTGVVVRDLTAGNAIATVPVPPLSGAMGDPSWPTPDHQFVYTVPAANLGAARENHCCEVLAFVRVGVADPDVSFGISPMFIIRNP
jgi:hypothetical protein